MAPSRVRVRVDGRYGIFLYIFLVFIIFLRALKQMIRGYTISLATRIELGHLCGFVSFVSSRPVVPVLLGGVCDNNSGVCLPTFT